MEKIYVKILIVTSAFILTQNQGENGDVNQFLENIRQVLNKILKSQPRVNRQPKQNRKQLKTKIRRQIIKKLTTPSFRRPEHNIIRYKIEDTKAENNKNPSTDSQKIIESSQNQVSKTLDRIYRTNPDLQPFKFIDFKKILNQFLQGKSSKVDKDKNDENKSQNIDYQTNEYMEALRGWYIELSQNAINFWKIFKELFLKDENSLKFLRSVLCPQDNPLLPQIKTISETNIFIPMDLINEYLLFKDGKKYLNGFYRLVKNTMDKERWDILEFPHFTGRLLQKNCEEFKLKKNSLFSKNESLCVKLQILNIYGDCVNSHLEYISQCIATFNKKEDMRSCDKLHKSVIAVNNFARQWFKYAYRLYTRDIITSYLLLRQQEEPTLKEEKTDDILYLLIYENNVKPLLIWSKNFPENSQLFEELIKKLKENDARIGQVFKQLQTIKKLIDTLQNALGEEVLNNIDPSEKTGYIKKGILEHSETLKEFITMMKDPELKTGLARIFIIASYKLLREIYEKLVKFKNEKVASDMKDALNILAILKKLSPSIIIAFYYIDSIYQNGCNLAFLKVEEEVENFARCVLEGENLIENCLKDYAGLLRPFFQIFTNYVPDKKINPFFQISNSKSIGSPEKAIENFCRAIFLPSECSPIILIKGISVSMVNFCSQKSCEDNNFLETLKYCYENCKCPSFISSPGSRQANYQCHVRPPNSPICDIPENNMCPAGKCKTFCNDFVRTIPLLLSFLPQEQDLLNNETNPGKLSDTFQNSFKNCCANKCYLHKEVLEEIENKCYFSASIPTDNSITTIDGKLMIENLAPFFTYIFFEGGQINSSYFEKPLHTEHQCKK